PQGPKGDTGEAGPKGPKGDKGEDYTENLVTTTVSNGTLRLTTDKYQLTTLSNGNTISLPSVSKFTQIHLFFSTTSELTLTFPSVRWQRIPDIQALRTYEFIFTYVDGTWLGGWIVYE
ncbi:MAG: collagen-like protein, partial [Turicibacter sp.]